MTVVNECFDGQFTEVTCEGADQLSQLNEELARLSGNDLFLRSLFEITQQGKALFICQAPVSDVSLGSPVYYDTANAVFKKSRVAFTTVGEELKLAASSQVDGLVATYENGADVATVLIAGLADVNLTASTGFNAPSGVFYLTRSSGLLSLTEDPSVSVAVLKALGDGRVIFRPQWATPTSLYRLRKFNLSPNPAGTFITVAGKSQIPGNGDPLKQGWLPVGSPVFDGMVKPAGAKFGYNLARHFDVQEIWPPVPLSLVRIEWEPEGDGRGGSGQVSESLCKVNEDGIWWLQDCTDQVPWSNTGASSSCGVRMPARIQLLFPANVTNQLNSVTSLTSLSPSLNFFRVESTDEASTGDLAAALSVEWALGSTIDDISPLSVKGVGGDGLLNRGPTVVGIKSSSAELAVTGGSLDANGYRYGQLDISLGGPQRSELLPQRVALDGAATDESYEISLAVGFPPNQSSSMRSQFFIPTLDSDEFFLVQYEAWLQLPLDGLLPELALSARAYEPPTSTPGNSPTIDKSLGFVVPTTTLRPGQYVEVISEGFAVKAGSVISAKLLRDSSLGDRSSVEARVIKHLLRIIRPAAENEVTDPEIPQESGIFAAEFVSQFT